LNVSLADRDVDADAENEQILDGQVVQEPVPTSRAGSVKDLGMLPPKPFFSLSRRRSMSSGDVLVAARQAVSAPSVAERERERDRAETPSPDRHRRTKSCTEDPLASPQTPRSRRSSYHQKIETNAIYAKSSKPELVNTPSGEEQTEGRVNQYHILREIGSGAYGRVVLVRDEESGIYYACKIVSKSRLRKKFRRPGGLWQEDGEEVDPIKREIAILKKVSNHPNINQLIEVMDDTGEDSLYMGEFWVFGFRSCFG
jgi:hypothetical protein